MDDILKLGHFPLNNVDLQLSFNTVFSYANKWPNPADPFRLRMGSQVYLSYLTNISHPYLNDLPGPWRYLHLY